MPLKLLIVASSYPPNVGGLQTVASGLAGELLRRGYAVQVITARVPRALPAREHIDDIDVSRWTFLVPRLTYLRRGRADLWLAGIVSLPVALARLLRRIARERPDVVNLQFAGSPALCVLLAHRLRPFRLVVSLHGHDVEGLPLRSALDRATLSSLLRRADLVTACSRYLAEQAVLLEPRVTGRLRVVYNGLPLQPCPPAATLGAPPAANLVAPDSVSSERPSEIPSFRPSDGDSLVSGVLPSDRSLEVPPPVAPPAADLNASTRAPTEHSLASSPAAPPTLFAAGRLVPKKGFDVLLRALAQCSDQSLCLTLNGDGPERDVLHTLAHELHLDERVFFAGTRSHVEVIAGMCHSSLVVVPSRQEPFGLVALEAMQTGRPVVASEAGGLPEVLAGADALLVPPGDAAALAAAIDQVLARLVATPAYGARNRELATRFSLAAMVDGYAQVYADVMAP